MISYYLSTTDEATMQTVLINLGLASLYNNTLIGTGSTIIDIIGLWYQPTGQFTIDETGCSVPVMAQVPGWYFNVYSEQEIAWPQEVTVSTPITPWRVLG